MPRIPLLTSKDQLPEEQHAEYDAIHEILHRVGGPFGVLLYSPGLAEKVCKAGAQVRLGSLLTMAERELALLSTSREKDAVYEWATHSQVGRDAGISEDAMVVMRDKGDPETLANEDERDIIKYTRELLRTNRVSQELFDALVARHSVRWVVEVTATIGQYQYIAAINNAFELEPRPDGEVLPIPAPGSF